MTTGLGSSLAYLLSRAERSVNRGLAAAVTAEDVTVEQWRILRALADGRGHSMGELAEAVLMPHPTLTKAIDRLIDRSLVYRGHDPADRRRVAVFLSDRGAELLARVEGGVAGHHRLIEAAYGIERTEQLMRDLHSLVTALDEPARPVERPDPGGPARS
ncbi:MarR family winged helix-turn-helix transcriptional regulator [Streptosporangium sp. NBC_01756]|uniref:MarR family winged helix-turn-helix transcriptional regulator n=1 Tax=Streptosporangium sp. NBC_01756 TaxID=2975950 RepID=UPI002DDBF71D|nr:MarR family transcriptional regulator [Streptosporangium sp. NBC_01756]WSC84562.1 MarR family transcriptional regulator [Streptosporangium sp. NBC_01756]